MLPTSLAATEVSNLATSRLYLGGGRNMPVPRSYRFSIARKISSYRISPLSLEQWLSVCKALGLVQSAAEVKVPPL